MKILRGYTVLSLEVIYSSWEWTFIFAAAFILAKSEYYGGIISSGVFSTIVIVRILLGKTLSSHIEKIKFLRRKLYISLLARFILCIMGFLLIYANISSVIFILFWIIFAGICFVIDNYSSLEIRYILNKNPHFHFARISSFSNIGKRGLIAFSSIIAANITSWSEIGIIIFCLMLLGLVSMVLIIFNFNDNNDNNDNIKSCNKPISYKPDSKDFKNIEAINLNVFRLKLTMFILNLFHGSCSLLIINSISKYSLKIAGINALTFFYITFIMVNIYGIMKPKIFDSYCSWKYIIISYIFMSLFCITYWIVRNNIYEFVFIALIFGAFYAFLSIILYTKISFDIRGENTTNHYASIDIYGRSGLIISIFTSGLLLDYGIDPLKINAYFGITAIAVFICIYYFHKIRRA